MLLRCKGSLKTMFSVFRLLFWVGVLGRILALLKPLQSLQPNGASAARRHHGNQLSPVKYTIWR